MGPYKKYIKPYLSAFILGPVFMIVEVLGEIILPKLMAVIINIGCGAEHGVEAKGTGFIIAMGMLVDNAIVVFDSALMNMERG